MKSFLKIFFASFLAIIAVFVVFLFILGGIAGGSAPVLKPSANSVLNLTLKGEITDRAYSNPFRNLSPMSAITGSISDQSTIGLFELKEVLKHAEKDDNIKGIFLNVDEMEAGPSTMFDLHHSLEAFRKSGKFIYAYSNAAGEMNLMLANVADKFYMNPVGMCEFDGFAMQREYMKGLYDKLGVDFKIFYVGEYKSATEGYRRTDMSAEDKEQRLALLADMESEYFKSLNKSTGLSADSLRLLQNQLAVMNANEAVSYRLADGLRYEAQVWDEIKSKLGYKKSEEVSSISYAKYKEYIKLELKAGKDPKIAVIYAEGVINDSKEEEGTIGGQAYVKMLQEAAKDDAIKAVVLRVNSPGGSAFASEQIYYAIQQLKAKKPIVVSMGDYAASGGYYISAPADKIIAQPTTITGSIGIYGIIPNLKKALNDKLGITFDEVKTAEHANYMTLTNDWDEAEMKKMQQHIETGYGIFLDRVAKGRKMDTAAVNKVARGRVWTGEDAKALGLVDELGGLELAVSEAKKLAHLKQATLVTYPKEKTMIESLMQSVFGDEQDAEAQAQLLKLSPQLLLLKQQERLKSLGIVQYMLPYDMKLK